MIENELVRRRLLLGAGMSRSGVTRLVDDRNLIPVRPGWHTAAHLEYPEDRHRLQVVAAVHELKEAADFAVVSHASAAVVHRLPIWGLDLSRVEITYPGSAGVRSSRSVRPHRAKLTDDEVTTIDGIRVTTLARTVLDIARTAPFTQAVVVADAALRQGLDLSELQSVWEIARSRHSASSSMRVFEFADGRSEGVLESVSRVGIAAMGLPEPNLQVVILDKWERFVGRVDFEFEDFKTVGESDGESKYSTLLRLGETAADVMSRQLTREARILATDRQIARWGMKDILGDPGEVARRCVAAFHRAGFTSYEPGPSRLPFLRWRSLQQDGDARAG